MYNFRAKILAILDRNFTLGEIFSFKNGINAYGGVSSRDFVPSIYLDSSMRFLNDQLERLESSWSFTNAGKNQLMEAWSTAVTDFELACERFGPLEKSFDHLITDYKLCSSSYPVESGGEDVQSQFIMRFITLAGCGTTQISGLFPRIAVSTASIVSAACAMLKNLELDATMPWFWNMERFWIHIATIQMISELQVCPFHRRMLKRLQRGMDHPEEIIII